jgi:hypothetical protein
MTAPQDLGPAAKDVAANIYRWERGTVTPSNRYRLYYVPRVIITISLPEGTDTQIKLTSTESLAAPDTGT